ncbi:hypothetical protein [Undibacterium sp.]|jgi:chromosome partitioning protein|uniref:hypothetical protein n=1 Tax=Undibacterium sp. TaxID=1914977 RepID=UPI002CA71FE4|nr:hypothetical protein [Undibacterium sp.]HTD06821.1 hypothetical protein [Undibacterium sp.]
MILTIAPIGPATGAGSAASLASLLACRRANAGRNVLLIRQKTSGKQVNQHSKARDECAWLATEVKTGAKTRPLAAAKFADELACARDNYHDIVIDMPRLQHADSLYLLAATGLAVFAIQTASWNRDRQKRLVQRISAARSWNPALPVLVIADEVDSLAGQAMISGLAERVRDIRFIHLDVEQQDLQANPAPLSALYRAIYVS